MFRKIAGLAEEIQRSQPPVNLWRKFIYCTSLTGSILGSVDHMCPQGLVGLFSIATLNVMFGEYFLFEISLSLWNVEIRTCNILVFISDVRGIIF